MKRDDKKKLLSGSQEELQKSLRDLQAQLIKARQEKFLQDRTQVDIRMAYKLRDQIKMIKTELRRRELAGATE
jgi:hypothetical protein